MSQIAHNLQGRIHENAQQVFGLAEPLGLRGMDVFKCMFSIIVLPRLTFHPFFSAVIIPLPVDLRKPITELQTDNDLIAKYLLDCV